MKFSFSPRLFAASALALLAFGCASIDSRIKEKSTVFAALTPEQQQVVRNGFIAVGFTPDMVYIALDKPEKVVPGATPGTETWIYHNFYGTTSGVSGPGGIDRSNMGKVPVDAVGGAGGLKVNGQGQATGGGAPTGGDNRQAFVDPAADAIKEAAAIKVHVIFTAGKVSDIQLMREH